MFSTVAKAMSCLPGGAQQVDGAVRRQRHRRRGPAAAPSRRHREQPPRDIVERLHPEHVIGSGDFLDRLGRGRRHHQLRRGRLAGGDPIERPGDQRAFAEAAERALQLHDQPAADHVLDVGIGGDRHRHQPPARGQQAIFVGPEGLAPAHEGPAAAAIVEGDGAGGDVRGGTFEEWSAPKRAACRASTA